MKLPSSKYYCGDCGRVMDGMEYMEHSADHWVSKVQMVMIPMMSEQTAKGYLDNFPQCTEIDGRRFIDLNDYEEE
jgi:hypothetical protein